MVPKEIVIREASKALIKDPDPFRKWMMNRSKEDNAKASSHCGISRG